MKLFIYSVLAFLLFTGLVPAEEKSVSIVIDQRGAPEHGAFTQDGKKFVTGGEDGTVRVWDTQGNELLKWQGAHRGNYYASFSPDGKKIVLTQRGVVGENTLQMIDAETGKSLKKLEPTGRITSVAFSPDGKKIVTTEQDSLLVPMGLPIRIWDAETGMELPRQRLIGHTRGAHFAAFLPDGERILSVSHDYTIRLWSTDSGKELRRFQVMDNPPDDVRTTLWSVDFSSDGRKIAAAIHGNIRIWDADTGTELKRFATHDTYYYLSLSFSPDGKKVMTVGHGDSRIRIWDAESGWELQRLDPPDRVSNKAIFSPDGKMVVTGPMVYRVRIWDLDRVPVLPPPIVPAIRDF